MVPWGFMAGIAVAACLTNSGEAQPAIAGWFSSALELELDAITESESNQNPGQKT